MRELVELASRVADLERRFSGVLRHGTVHEVDPAKAIVRVKYGEDAEGKPFLSPWLPYAQIAGALKIHTPPTVGQQMTSIAPSGDWMQAVALPMHWSDQNKSPSSNGDENVLTYGNVRATIKNDLVRVVVGGCTLEVTGAHVKITVGGVTHVIDGSGITTTGGRIEHDGKNIGSTHKHDEVMPGSGLTGHPIP